MICSLLESTQCEVNDSIQKLCILTEDACPGDGSGRVFSCGQPDSFNNQILSDSKLGVREDLLDGHMLKKKK